MGFSPSCCDSQSDLSSEKRGGTFNTFLTLYHTPKHTQSSLFHTHHKTQISVAPSGNKCICAFNESHVPKRAHTHSILALSLPNTCWLLLISVPFHQLLHLTLSTPPPSITLSSPPLHPPILSFVSILLSISWYSGSVLTRAWP